MEVLVGVIWGSLEGNDQVSKVFCETQLRLQDGYPLNDSQFKSIFFMLNEVKNENKSYEFESGQKHSIVSQKKS